MEEGVARVLLRRATQRDIVAIASVLTKAFAQYEPLDTSEGFGATTPGANGVRKRIAWFVEEVRRSPSSSQNVA